MTDTAMDEAETTPTTAQKKPATAEKPKKGSKSRSKKAGIRFPVGRIDRQMKQGNYAKRIGGMVPVYVASVLEYLTAEILELAGNVSIENKHTRIKPRDVMLAIKSDEELDNLLKDYVFADSGVVPRVHEELVPVKRKKKRSVVRADDESG